MSRLLACALACALVSGCCPREEARKGPPNPTPLPSSIASTPPAPSGPYPWPLPPECYPATRCAMPDGKPGLQCTPAGVCFNPCPAGMAPELEGTYCSRTCKSDKECGAGKCVSGVCSKWPPKLECEGTLFCELPGGGAGVRCTEKDPCRNPCKPPLILYGGTHCAKPCKSAAECPGGECETGVCAPLCPSEGCPYRWE